ncbi:MAG: hypothetical protein J6S63_09325 [Atopobiaceae bacterium]|nr:hypothetical protein [Atopobiaceae bacterium]
MYELGKAVALTFEDAHAVGEVVGVRAVSRGYVYDVSLEDVVVKAVVQDDLRAVTQDELDGLLTSYLGATGVVTSERDAVLRQEYVAFLARARAVMDADAPQDDARTPARYAVGQDVVVQDDGAYALGRVVSVAVRSDGPSYLLEVMGENRRTGEDALCDLVDAPSSDGFALGMRVRFVAEGYEDDESFAGVLCACAPAADGLTFSLLFDDGDVLEDLCPADLARLPD